MSTLIESTERLYSEALATMKKKNADYAGGAGSMKNFEVSASIANVKMSQGILTRLVDKVSRIGNLLSKDQQEVKDESIFDTIQDLINYSAILYHAVEIERGEARLPSITLTETDADIEIAGHVEPPIIIRYPK